jgi:integrase
VSGSPARRPCVEDLVGAYRADLVAAGMFAGHPVTSVARIFFTRVGAAGWAQMPLADQCALPLKDRRVVGWLMVTGRLRPSPDYLVACRPYLGEVAAHHHRAFHARFAETSAGLGFGATVTRLQWSALAKVTALAGLAPDQVTQAVIDEGRQALTAAIGRHHPGSHGPGALSAALFGLQTTLFHLGVLDAAPRKTSPDRSAERAAEWRSAAPQLASTLAGYIAQVSLSLRASTMVRVEGVLREFACWLAASAPEVGCVADLRRRHIETYKLHLAGRPSARGGKLSRISLAEHLGALRACFERLTEWDGGDVPAAVLVFSGDLPLRDEPLPRFLDDGAFTKLLQATRADPDPFVRLAVEFLARTGLRKGEFLDLTVDSVVQIGAAYWLHVPLGKLRTDRYIPLHPQLKDLLDTWLAARPASLRTPYLCVEHGQRIGQGRVDRAVAKTARAAGIGHVSPHRLRHTLATQAKGRGVASNATFRVWREDGAVRDGDLGTAGPRSHQQSEPAGQDGRDRTALRQMPGCCIHSRCIRCKRDAVRATKKRSDERRYRYRPVITLTHSAWLVNRSLPVQPGHEPGGDSRPSGASIDADDHGVCASPTAPWPRSTSPSPGKSRPSTTPPRPCPQEPRAPRCASSAPRCTSGCSATATAPARSGWTVTSSPSASRARSSDHHRVPAHPASPARRRRRQRPGRPAENLRRAARPARGDRLMTSQPQRLTEPGELPAPRTDTDGAAVLAEAVDTLAALRTPYWLGDSAVGLHALASLIAQANKMIPDAVHAARDQGHTWAEIGQLLNLSPAAAARRYRTTT